AHAVRRIEVVAGHDGAHAGQRAGGGEVVAADPGVRVRALQDRAMQHAGAVEVGDVLRTARELLLALELGDGAPDRALLSIDSSAHQCSPSARAAACTAATILR